jgi:hypothetical protein
MPILYVIAGLVIYEKAIKPMLEKKETLENADEYE